MRKTYKILLLFLISISISCEKNEEQLSLKDRLIGNWNYQKLINSSYKSNGTLINEIVTPITSTNYGYVFNDDGSCVYRFGGSPTKFTYQIISETKFELNTGTKNLCKILSIDEANVVFTIGGPTQAGNNYTTSTHYLSR